MSSDFKKALFGILILLNNLVGGTILGITFLTGPAYGTPFWKIVLGLVSYVLVVSSLFSLITTVLFVAFKRLKATLQFTYLKAFMLQMALFVGGYLIAYLSVFCCLGE